jgi:hypothetical protein
MRDVRHKSIGPSETAFADALLSIRSWERSHIPLHAPQISFDILLHVAASVARHRPARMKELHLAIGYSQDRIREVVHQLAADDWIELIADARDGRSRFVQPTAKALRLLEDYRAQLLRGVGSAVTAQAEVA